jgi:hypothetical protein
MAGKAGAGRRGRMSGPRIFQIGFNRCGTISLHRFFLDCGLASVHWAGGELARKMIRRINAGDDPIADFPQVVAFTDMICNNLGDALLEPYKRFDYLDAWHPTALFILNTRPIEHWLKSREAVSESRLPPPFNRRTHRYAAYLGLSEEQVLDYWRAEWLVHHAQVRAYFRDNPRFLEFDIERDDPARLSAFVSTAYPAAREVRFGRHHVTDGEAKVLS